MASLSRIRSGVRAGLVAAAGFALGVGSLLAPTNASAKFVFPYNHPDLEWYTIETEHFFIHYPVSRHRTPDDPYYINPEYSARKMAKVAEEMWGPMTSEFDNPLVERIHIVLLDQSDDLEGFTIPAWDWIEISANPGGYFYRMRGRMEWFSDVLVHEFAHVVSLKKNAPFAEGSQGVLIGGLYRDGVNDEQTGGEFFIADSDPFWWTEGGAEYWSDNTGYNWWTSSRDTNLRTTVLEDRLLTYDEWVTVIEKRDWDDGERGYQGGYSFGLYLRERFGDKTYARFAQTSDKKWRLQWEKIVEEVTGVPLRTLYDDWKAYLETRYAEQYAEVKELGETHGVELLMEHKPFQFTDPDGYDAFMGKQGNETWQMRRRDREDEKEATGRWEGWPRYSDDGRWFAETSGGYLTVKPVPEDKWPGLAGSWAEPDAYGTGMTHEDRDIASHTLQIPMAFMYSFDFVPGEDRLVVSGGIHDGELSPFHLETRGYNFNQLEILDLKPKVRKGKSHGEKVDLESFDMRARELARLYTPIPNTFRGQDPAVSPDGKKVAYFEYFDGTLNLVTINLDGTEKTPLTHFHDGTWLQNADWSPDGKRIVFSLFKGYREDLYVINADGTGLVALNRDTWEDQDAHWAADGNIYFSSDPEGKFNIYRYNPETGKVHQLTNVIGGAYMPWITPEGNLLFMLWTAHGWKNWSLSSTEFLDRDVTSEFGLNPDQSEVAEFVAYTEDLSEFAEKTSKYHWSKAIMYPTMVPMFRVENDSRTNLGLQGGFQVFAQDYAEKHGAFIMAMLGEDPLFLGQYFNQMTYGDIFVMAYHYQAKFDYAFLIDDDNDLTTTDDQAIYDGKQHQYVNIGVVGYSYPWNESLTTSLSVSAIEYGFRGVSDTKFEPFLRQVGPRLEVAYEAVRGLYYGAPTGGRAIDFTWEPTFSDIVYAPYNGRDSDDGQIFDKYGFNRFELDWTENLAAPTFWGAFPGAKKRSHTLTLSARVGVIDRNVQYQDEFRGGGTHPYYVGSGNIQPNNQFSGYPGYSLSGETMVVLSAAYRFPLVRQLNKKMGPWYVYDLNLVVGGTTGNFWSYRPPDESAVGTYYTDDQGNRIAYDPKDVRREIPFVDVAYKNGNRLLWDATAELRLSSTLGGVPWDSFFRMAWGFNRIHGVGDVNEDDIQDTTETGFGTAVSNETEAPGPRFYIGIGTGW